MNQKECSLSANFPQKIKMVILNGELMRTAEAAFWRVSSGKLFLNSWSILRKITTMESDLNKVVLATLLISLSVMGNFLEVFQEFNKNSFQYKKHLLGVVFFTYHVFSFYKDFYNNTNTNTMLVISKR